MEITEKIRPLLVKMEVGETKEFPIIRLKSVRTQASELGAMLGRWYTTKTDRKKGVICVLRME